jgi:transcriptional regulator with XRE-family HTH domain
MPTRTTPEDREVAIVVTAHVLAAMDELGLTQNAIERRAGFTAGRPSRFMSGRRVDVPLGFLSRLAPACGSNPSRMLTRPADPRFQKFLAQARRRHLASGRRSLSAP